MKETALNTQEKTDMRDNPYSLAGWLSIVQAILFPLAFIVSIVQGAIGFRTLHYKGPALGPSDIIFIVFTILSIYVFLTFKKFLHERYNYHGIDTLIIISIFWGVIFEFGMIASKPLLVGLSPVEEATSVIIFIGFYAISMITIGIVDIFIAVKLLKTKGTFSDLIKVFAYISLVAGICEVTVIFSIVSLLLVSVLYILLAMMLLRDEEGVEFV